MRPTKGGSPGSRRSGGRASRTSDRFIGGRVLPARGPPESNSAYTCGSRADTTRCERFPTSERHAGGWSGSARHPRRDARAVACCHASTCRAWASAPSSPRPGRSPRSVPIRPPPPALGPARDRAAIAHAVEPAGPRGTPTLPRPRSRAHGRARRHRGRARPRETPAAAGVFHFARAGSFFSSTSTAFSSCGSRPAATCSGWG